MELKKEQLREEDWGKFYEVVNNFLINKYDKINTLPPEKLFIDLIYHISGVTEMEMLRNETNRKTKYVWARYMHIYLHHILYKYPISSTKNLLYGKDHSSCSSAIKKVHELIKVDHEFRKKYAAIWIIWNQYDIKFHMNFPIDSIKNLFL